jgi:protein-S-isoprenylcysteine O-methyltransferase Ste14
MSHEGQFRMALVVLSIATLAVLGYYRVQAGRSGERIDRRQEGLLLAIALRLVGLGMWAGMLAYLINPDWMAWAQVALPDEIRWLGALCGVLFIALIYWTLSNLGKNLTDSVVTRSAATLVTSGPYRYIRHPFYVSVALVIAAIALLSANVFLALTGTATLLLLALRTPIEERKLLERFGEPYRAYVARTGRFLPRLRRSG